MKEGKDQKQQWTPSQKQNYTWSQTFRQEKFPDPESKVVPHQNPEIAIYQLLGGLRLWPSCKKIQDFVTYYFKSVRKENISPMPAYTSSSWRCIFHSQSSNIRTKGMKSSPSLNIQIKQRVIPRKFFRCFVNSPSNTPLSVQMFTNLSIDCLILSSASLQHKCNG